MTSIPLRDVLDFLRPRNAFGVLYGAPFIGADEQMHCLQPDDTTPRTVARLYLGTSEICPAAEGWAARVLALALGTRATHVYDDARGRICLFNGGRLECQWWWPDDEAVAIFRERRMDGAPPATPADRLAAVLRYEMERAR